MKFVTMFNLRVHSYINNYPIEFTLLNYSVRDILLDTSYRIAETGVLFDRGWTKHLLFTEISGKNHMNLVFDYFRNHNPIWKNFNYDTRNEHRKLRKYT